MRHIEKQYHEILIPISLKNWHGNKSILYFFSKGKKNPLPRERGIEMLFIIIKAV